MCLNQPYLASMDRDGDHECKISGLFNGWHPQLSMGAQDFSESLLAHVHVFAFPYMGFIEILPLQYLDTT